MFKLCRILFTSFNILQYRLISTLSSSLNDSVNFISSDVILRHKPAKIL